MMFTQRDSTTTVLDWEEVQDSVRPLLRLNDQTSQVLREHMYHLNRSHHVEYLSSAVRSVPDTMQHLDASQPWLLYWTLHALDILDAVHSAFSDMAPELQDWKVTSVESTSSPLNQEDCPDSVLLGGSLIVKPLSALAYMGFERGTSSCDEKESSAAPKQHFHCPACQLTTEKWTSTWSTHYDLLTYHRRHSPHCTRVRGMNPTRWEAVEFLRVCYQESVGHAGGGYGGGPGQLPHLAPTYAAVNALLIIGATGYPWAYESIPKESLLAWMQSLKQPDGSFQMHHGGEVDIRASYCVVTVVSLLNMGSASLFSGIGAYLLRCQTYEGGFACNPNDEAHGGYTFCAAAGLSVLLSHRALPSHFLASATGGWFDRLRAWTSRRQHPLLKGINGRTNKLIDSCYSFWVGSIPILLGGIQARLASMDAGGAFPFRVPISNEVQSYFLCDMQMGAEGELGATELLPPSKEVRCYVNSMVQYRDLKEFVLMACQCNSGGLRDKPGMLPDYYHSCYALSGLSLAAQYELPPLYTNNSTIQESVERTLPSRPNLSLRTINPVYNLTHRSVGMALRVFHPP